MRKKMETPVKLLRMFGIKHSYRTCNRFREHQCPTSNWSSHSAGCEVTGEGLCTAARSKDHAGANRSQEPRSRREDVHEKKIEN